MLISRVLRTLRWFGDAVIQQVTINFAILFFIIKFVRLLEHVLRLID